ncbi:MAG: magnesium-translocating P-type ATPase [Bacteroidetes bacterium]|nr:magnesium-translocating P-type ATPase [Bacteroidota bacterium]
MINPASDPVPQLFDELKSSAAGLTHTEAERRLRLQQGKEHTQNRFARELHLLIRQFRNPLVLLLLVAVLLSGIMRETTDMFIILAILLATGFLSFIQELNAGRSVEKLQQMLAVTVGVLREEKTMKLKSSEIVPGDILELSAGDIIPADCRILESEELHVNESALTGESFSVEKSSGDVKEGASISEKTNCLWKGTHIISGTAKALVVLTGNNTIFGQLKSSLEHEEETVFEKGIRNFGIFLLKITLVLSICILVINIIFHKPIADSILFSLAIAVGMAPELLPAIMTLSMTAGAKRMLRKKVIVKKLTSIINFGEVTVLCTDKTGTLTEGVSRVNRIVDADGKEDAELYRMAKVNASLQGGFTNPIDDALRKLGEDISGYNKCGEIPYDFKRKRLSIVAEKNSNYTMITKGALTNVLDVCTSYFSAKEIRSLGKDDLARITSRFREYGEQGFRVLGLAYKNFTTQKITKTDEANMIFLGFILLEDPLKEGVLHSIERFKKLNTTLKIITGDNRHVAAYTAAELGLDTSQVLLGSGIAAMSPEALKVKVKAVQVFAEIEPQQKEHIIRALQQSGEAVAYMGDGINDVAAIHAADTGISVNDAVDVAKEAADFVLLEKDLSVLADGITEGRKTFANSLKYIFISTGATFGNMFSVAGASLLLPFLPMLPKQILLTNFLTDFPYLAVSDDNVDDSQIEKPSRWNLKTVRRFMIVFGLHSSVFDFLTFFYLYFTLHLKESGFQTGWFLESVITELVILFVIRSSRSFLKSKPSHLLILIAVLMAAFTMVLIYTPLAALFGLQSLPLAQLLMITGILFLYLVTADILKIFFFRYAMKKQGV